MLIKSFLFSFSDKLLLLVGGLDVDEINHGVKCDLYTIAGERHWYQVIPDLPEDCTSRGKICNNTSHVFFLPCFDKRRMYKLDLACPSHWQACADLLQEPEELGSMNVVQDKYLVVVGKRATQIIQSISPKTEKR